MMLLFSVFYAYPYPVLNTFGGRLADVKIQTTHLHHGPLNNDRCWTNKRAWAPTSAYDKREVTNENER